MLPTIADKAYSSAPLFQALRDRIVSGEYPPGTLLSEKELTHEFNVSRTPYREALKQLENIRLVKVVPRFGTFVSEINIQEVLHAYEVRIGIESKAAEFAALRRTSEDLAEFRQIIDQCIHLSHNENIVNGSYVDEDLHHFICKAAKNPILIDTVFNLRLSCARIWTSFWWKSYNFEQLIADWENIYQAVKNQNMSDASTFMAAHLQDSINAIKHNIFGPQKMEGLRID